MKKLSDTETELNKSFAYKKACISASNVNNIIFTHIKISLIRNKFDSLINQITGYMDVDGHRNRTRLELSGWSISNSRLYNTL